MAFCDIILFFWLILNCQEKGLSFYIIFHRPNVNLIYLNSMEIYYYYFQDDVSSKYVVVMLIVNININKSKLMSIPVHQHNQYWWYYLELIWFKKKKSFKLELKVIRRRKTQILHIQWRTFKIEHYFHSQLFSTHTFDKSQILYFCGHCFAEISCHRLTENRRLLQKGAKLKKKTRNSKTRKFFQFVISGMCRFRISLYFSSFETIGVLDKFKFLGCCIITNRLEWLSSNIFDS